MTMGSPSERTVKMTEIEKLKRRIDLNFQYITLLGEKIDETREEIRVLQDELVELERKEIIEKIKKVYVDPPIPEVADQMEKLKNTPGVIYGDRYKNKPF